MGGKCNLGYPDSNSITPSQLIYIQRAMTALDTLIDMDPNIIDPSITDSSNPHKFARLKYRDFIDIDSWGLFFLHMELSMEQDNFANSVYFYKKENTRVFDCTLPTSTSVVINEIAPSNLLGAADWVEFYNVADHEIVLQGWFFTDDKDSRRYLLDAFTIGAGSTLLIEDIGFGLGSSDEVNLYDANEDLVDSAKWFSHMDLTGKSLARCPNGNGLFSISNEVTKGSDNLCGAGQACEEFPASEYYAPPLPNGAKFGKWGAGPTWDYNLAYQISKLKDSWVHSKRFWIELITADPFVADRLVTLWTQLRDPDESYGVWSDASLKKMVIDAKNHLIASGIRQELSEDNFHGKFFARTDETLIFFNDRLTGMDDHICSLHEDSYHCGSSSGCFKAYPDALKPQRDYSQGASCSNCQSARGKCVCGLCVCKKQFLGESCQFDVGTPPDAPSNLALVSRGTHSLEISWDIPNAKGSVITDCKLFAISDNTSDSFATSSVEGTTNTATINNLYDDTFYNVHVICESEHGGESLSSEVVRFQTLSHSAPVEVRPLAVLANRDSNIQVVGSERGDILEVIATYSDSCQNDNRQQFVFGSSLLAINLPGGVYELCFKRGTYYRNKGFHDFTKIEGVDLLSIPDSTTTVTKTTLDSHDDAEENVDAYTVDVSSSDLEIGNDGSKPQVIGIRIPDVNFVANGGEKVYVSAAFLKFTSKDDQGGPIKAVIRGLRDTNPFTSGQGLFSDRRPTSAYVTWDIEPWTTDAVYQSPDISTIVQELIDQNISTLVFSISAECRGCVRRAYSNRGTLSIAPALEIEYATGPLSVSSNSFCQCSAAAPTAPTTSPTKAPTMPTMPPTLHPTFPPTTAAPTMTPTTASPTTASPTSAPSVAPPESYTQLQGMSCWGKELIRDKFTLPEAKLACSANNLCGAIYDGSCNGGNYYLCQLQTTDTWKTSSKSCLYRRNDVSSPAFMQQKSLLKKFPSSRLSLQPL
jgi:hypothetical protein